MIEDVRRMYALRNSAKDTGYIPLLYVKSDYNFKRAPDKIEDAVETFQDAIRNEQLQRSLKKKPRPNLTFQQLKLMGYFKTTISTS